MRSAMFYLHTQIRKLKSLPCSLRTRTLRSGSRSLCPHTPCITRGCSVPTSLQNKNVKCEIQTLVLLGPVAVTEWIAEQEGSRSNPRHPISAEICMQGTRVATLLAVKRSAGAASEVNLSSRQGSM